MSYGKWFGFVPEKVVELRTKADSFGMTNKEQGEREAAGTLSTALAIKIEIGALILECRRACLRR